MTAAIYAKGMNGPDNPAMNALRTYCRANGWEVVAEFQDRNGRQRPQFLKVMEQGKRGRYNVLVASLDSVGGNGGALGAIRTLNQLAQYGIRFASVEEPYMTQESVVALIAALANLEKDRVRQKVKFSVAASKAAGVTFGRPRLEIDHTTVFQMHAQRQSLRTIAKHVGASVPTISRILAEQA